jgi:hypothetical protein
VTESTAKKIKAATDMHTILGYINNLISSSHLEEDVVGKRVRSRLLKLRYEMYSILDYWEDK